MIEDKDGRWIEDEGGIMAAFKDTFEELFKGNNGEEEDRALQHILTLISTQDNSYLL